MMMRPSTEAFSNEHLCWSLGPLLRVLKVFGIFLCTTKKDGNQGTVFRSSKLSRIYSLVSLTILLFICFRKWDYVKDNKLLNLSDISKFFEYAIDYGQFLGFGITVLIAAFRNREQVMLLNGFIELDNLIEKNFGFMVDYRRTRNIITSNLVIAFGVFVAMIQLDHDSFDDEYIDDLLLLPELIFVFGFVWCYAGVISLLLCRIKLMKEIFLRRLEDAQQTDDGLPIMPLNKNVVLSLREMYNRLAALAAGVNREFGVQITFAIGINCIALPYYCYFLFLMIERGSGILSLIDSIGWIFVFAAPVILVTTLCQEINSVTEDLIYLMHRAVKVSPGEDFIMQLNILSMQVSHDKLIFSACDLFLINANFLSYVKALATNMMILIQFDLQEKVEIKV